MHIKIIAAAMLAVSVSAPLAFAEEVIIQQNEPAVDEDTTSSVIIRRQEPAVVIQRQAPTVVIKKQPGVVIDQDDGSVYEAE